MSNKAKGRTHLTGATGIGEVAVRRSFTQNRITRKRVCFDLVACRLMRTFPVT